MSSVYLLQTFSERDFSHGDLLFRCAYTWFLIKGEEREKVRMPGGGDSLPFMQVELFDDVHVKSVWSMHSITGAGLPFSMIPSVRPNMTACADEDIHTHEPCARLQTDSWLSFVPCYAIGPSLNPIMQTQTNNPR